MRSGLSTSSLPACSHKDFPHKIKVKAIGTLGRGSRVWASLHFAFNKLVFRPRVSVGLQDGPNEDWSHWDSPCHDSV